MVGLGRFLHKFFPHSDLSTSIIPPPTKFNPENDIPDLSGKACHSCLIALVTGGNAGLGYETAKQLLIKGAKVYIAARSPDKAAQAIERLQAETKAPSNRILFVKLDLADLNSVRSGAADFLANEQRLDILFNNGGVMTTPPELLTAQNFDLQFGTNVLGHFFFTELLIPALRASHAATGVRARVVNVASWGHNVAPKSTGIVVETLKQSEARNQQIKKWGMLAPLRLYGQSKLGNILVSNHLAREYSDILVSCAVHPGFISTDLGRHSRMQNLAWQMFSPPHMGAQTQLWAGTTASGEEINGQARFIPDLSFELLPLTLEQYLIPWARVAPSGVANKMSQSLETEKMLVAYMRSELEGF
ncbi:NAD-P-binding protein [Mycena crocata]|nr:NAD-P-binding protein [Mycena crocata]